MIDHLVYGTPDLAATVHDLEERLGLRLSSGGQHLGLGTRNFLADLGDRRYLEVVGPDLEQPDVTGGRLFGVDSLAEPRLVTWAIRVDDLAEAHRRASAAGCELGQIRSMHRDSADGVPISWRMTSPLHDVEFGGVVPFVVEWGNSPHPADRAARGLRLVSLAAFWPDVDALRGRLDALGVSAELEQRPGPGLRAVLDTPVGEAVLD